MTDLLSSPGHRNGYTGRSNAYARTYLKCHARFKNGKEHRYWSLSENPRCAGGQIIQRQVLYLGEINDRQRQAWIKQIEVFDTAAQAPVTLALFPEDRLVPAEVASGIQVRLSAFELERPRQWGACWLALWLWELLELDQFWGGTFADQPGGDALGFTPGGAHGLSAHRTGQRMAAPSPLVWHDGLGGFAGTEFLVGRQGQFVWLSGPTLGAQEQTVTHLRQRWVDLFGAKFDVLLYDLTSSYFESDPPFEEGDKRRHGYSRDHRPDCVQVVLAPSLHATLRGKLRPLAPGLTPKAVLEKLAAIEIGARQNRRKMSRWSRRRVW